MFKLSFLSIMNLEEDAEDRILLDSGCSMLLRMYNVSHDMT
jgi:hypothetical protein